MYRYSDLNGRFSFDQEKRKWSLALNNETGFGIYDITGSIEVKGKTYFFKDADKVHIYEGNGHVDDIPGKRTLLTAIFTYSWLGLVWEVHFENFTGKPAIIIGSELINTSTKPLVLGKCCLLSIENKSGLVKIGKSHRKQSVFVFSGTQGPSYVKKIYSDKGKHISQALFLLHNPESGLALNTSFLTFDRIESEHSLAYSTAEGIKKYKSYCDFMGYNLMPGKKIDSEKMFVEIRDNPYATLERWADMVNFIYRPGMPSKIPVGWIGWSWVDPMVGENYEKVVLRNIKAIRKRLKGFDIEYIWISQGNLKDYIPGQWLKINRKNFPHFEDMLKTLRKMKFKPGLWVAPFWIGSLAKDEIKENENNFLRKDGRPLVSTKSWPFTPETDITKWSDMYSLDGSHPGSLDFIRKVFGAYRKMGIRYYMLDFVDGNYVKRYPYDDYFDKRMIKGPQVARNLLEEVRKAAGKDTHLLTAIGQTLQNVGIADAVRIAGDFGEGRPMVKHFSGTYPATMLLRLRGYSAMPLQNMAATYFTHARLYLNDINVLTVDKPVARSNAEIAATLFGISGSPMMLGDDIERIHPERLELIKKCLPRISQCAKPADLFKRTYPDDYPRIFVLPLEKKWGKWSICAVFNLDNQACKHDISMDELNLKNKDYHLYEFWNGQYLGVVQKSFEVDIPAYSCRLYRLEEVKPYPWILSTDMHILQGYVEIESLEWDAKKKVLKGSAARPAGTEGSLYVIAPEGYRLVNFNGHWVARDENTQALIIRRNLVFKTAKSLWELEFAEI